MQAISTSPMHIAEQVEISFAAITMCIQPTIGAILTISQIIKNVMSSAAEAELGALYIVAREAVYIRIILA